MRSGLAVVLAALLLVGCATNPLATTSFAPAPVSTGSVSASQLASAAETIGIRELRQARARTMEQERQRALLRTTVRQ